MTKTYHATAMSDPRNTATLLPSFYSRTPLLQNHRYNRRVLEREKAENLDRKGTLGLGLSLWAIVIKDKIVIYLLSFTFCHAEMQPRSAELLPMLLPQSSVVYSK